MLLYYQSCPWFPERFVVQICRPHWQMIWLWLATGLFVVSSLGSPPHMSSPSCLPSQESPVFDFLSTSSKPDELIPQNTDR